VLAERKIRFRPLLAFLLALAMAAGFFGFGGRRALAADVPSGWAQAEVDEARARGLVIAQADSNYQGSISRALFCALVVNLVETALSTTVTVSVSNPFQDTSDEDVVKAYQLGIVNGVSATQFAPDDLITREQIAAMMMRAARKLDDLAGGAYAAVTGTDSLVFADQDQISSWALADVRLANGLDIMKGIGDNRIGPQDNTSVEQSILLINRLYDGFTEYMSGVSAPENSAPQALSNQVSFAVSEQTELVIEASELATDPDGDALEVVAINGQTSPYSTVYGEAELTPEGKISYLSGDITANVMDDFVVTVSDGTDVAHVNIRVNVSYKFELFLNPMLSSVTLTGTPAMDETLSLYMFSYFGGVPSTSPTFSYCWMIADAADGAYTAISGAASSSYTVAQADVGKYIKLQVTASGSAGGSALSSAVGPVTYGFAGGSGTSAEPYLIATAKELMLLNVVPTQDAYFALTSDIPLGTGQYITALFHGTLYGYAHTVTLDIRETDSDYVGVFKKISGTGVVNGLQVDGVVETEQRYAGGIAGYNAGRILACTSSVSIRSGDYAGGIAAVSTGVITRSASSASLEARNHVGGIVGYNGGTVSRSFSSADCSVDANAMAGGIAGFNTASGGSVIDCYSRAQVFASGNEGGLIGWNEGSVADCYAAGKVSGYNNIGGLIGHVNGGTVSRSYYDKEVSGQSDTGRGTPKTTAEMKTQSTFTGWDFGSIWSYVSDSYPLLR